MTDPKRRRDELLRGRAASFALVAIENIGREFPNAVYHLMREPGDFPGRPKDIHPAFYGSYDFHSCVEMHWMLVRLLRVAADSVPEAEIRAALDEHFTEKALGGEAENFRGGRTGRPYAWGWVLTLAHELADWDDPDARRWAVNLRPLAEAVCGTYLRWLPKATYPVRQGAHENTAFSLSRALPFARLRADAGEPLLLLAIKDAALRWYADDADYPGAWEPSGADFLSPALTEAELMASLWPQDEFVPWFDRFLPGVLGGEPAALFTPAFVSDDGDGQIAHLHGLNLSRAWGWNRVADSLPEGDPRIPVLRATAAEHAEPELDNCSGSDYLVEHWLACYAVLYLS